MKINFILFNLFLFLISATFISSCGNSIHSVPAEFFGSWENTIVIDGSDADVKLMVEITDDTILVHQEFPRMNGVDKIKTIYAAHHIEKAGEGIYFFTDYNGIETRVEITPASENKLHVNFCQLNEKENEDTEFEACTDFGELKKK